MYLHLKKYFPQVEIKSKVSTSKTTEKEQYSGIWLKKESSFSLVIVKKCLKLFTLFRGVVSTLSYKHFQKYSRSLYVTEQNRQIMNIFCTNNVGGTRLY